MNLLGCYGGPWTTSRRDARSCAHLRMDITFPTAIVAPHTCGFGQGRVRCSSTCASRFLFRLWCLAASSTLALAKMKSLVVLNVEDVALRPSPMFTAIHSNLFRRRDFAVSQPPQQSHPVNPNFPRRFFRRISSFLHLCYTPIAYVVNGKRY